ncbi:Polynucleotide adenylyltransferase [Bertholletia excelsa]
MAHVHRNQGVFVPFKQLIDLRPVNQPVSFVPGSHIGLINPGNGPPVAPQFLPANPALIRMGFNPHFLARMEEDRSRSLLLFMADEGLVPSLEEEMNRKHAIEKLTQIVMEWIKRVACQRGLHRRHIRAASATVLTYGSYGLGVHNSESDIDALCVGPRFATMAEDFFILLYNMLSSRPEVSEVHCIKNAKVPLMRFKLDGISIDLPYAKLKVMSVPEVSTKTQIFHPKIVSQNVDILNPYFLRNIDETSWRSLSGVHANQCILRLLPNMQVFQSLLRSVKLWAKRRGLYGNLLGFFGGVHLTILAAFICQRHPNASLSVLIASFFRTFAFWPWPTPVILQDGLFPMPVHFTELRSLMPIRLPCRPREYCHSYITKSTFCRIRWEFHRGHTLTKDLLRPDFDWACLFEPFPCTKKYEHFVYICLSASSQDELGEWVGWVKSRLHNLLIKLEEILGFCDPNPTEYVDMNVEEPNVVFYWGLQLGQSGLLDLESVKEDFDKSLSSNYHGPAGKITLSIVQASQLPKNAEFNTESVDKSEACHGKLNGDHQMDPMCPKYLPPDVQQLTANANPEYPSAGG